MFSQEFESWFNEVILSRCNENVKKSHSILKEILWKEWDKEEGERE